ncbi:hypothetical protein BACCAP_03543 [Pseudoflavonifractor capillosus ATCC 29799]|uniref:Uncharacterized protein n=1 Tax=Pseudoflavonifractor capillosus ATCC 29799 TaxID=411467 RepID=A6NZ92_9FIRM|nr:hypothetical protein BACCAP_03543 [Pseudoflavonifractor capillosus ATCC 29799]
MNAVLFNLSISFSGLSILPDCEQIYNKLCLNCKR